MAEINGNIFQEVKKTLIFKKLTNRTVGCR